VTDKIQPPWERTRTVKSVEKEVTAKTQGKRKKGRASPIIVDEIIQEQDRESKLDKPTRLKYEAFAREYLVDFNLTNAAIRMGMSEDGSSGRGYPASIGNRWFHHPHTQRYLVELLSKIEDEALIDRKSVIHGLLKEANCEGTDARERAIRIAAWREIGKLCGMYVVRTEIDVRDMTPVINLTANKPNE